MAHRRISITTFAAVALVAVLTVLLGGFAALNYAAERSRQRDALSARADTTADGLAAALMLPLWNFDRPQIDRVIDSAMRDRNVSAVVVRQADVSAPGGVAVHGRTRDAAWGVREADANAAAPSETGGIERRREITSADQAPLGSVMVQVTSRFVEADLRRDLLQLVVVILALDLFMCATLYLILWAAVLRPVRRVQQYAAAVSTGERPEPSRGRLRCRELDELRGSLETMVRLLAQRYADLQQNQAMLAGILDAAPQSIFWKSRDGKYLGCNRVFAEAVGLSSVSDIVGKTDFDLPWPRGEAEAYLADDREVLESNQPKHHIIEPLQKADGTRHWVDTTKVPLADEAGRVYGVLGVYEDVTAQREAEEWRRQQAMFDELFARALTRFATAGGAGIKEAIEGALRDIAQFIGADHAYIILFTPDRSGWATAGEWCAPGVTPFHHDRRPVGVLPWTESTILAGEVVRVDALDAYPPEGAADLPFRRAEGARSILNVPIRGSAGLIAGGIGLHSHARERTWSDADVARLRLVGDSAANVLERQQAEEALRDSEGRFRAIFDRAPVGIAIVDSSSGALLQVNDEYCRIIGCTKEELTHGHLQDLVPAAAPPLLGDGTAAAGESRGDGDEEDGEASDARPHVQAQYRRRDGKSVWIELTLAPLGEGGGGSRDGGAAQHLAIVEDVTARRRAQDLLVESEKLRTVAGLAAGVAHEINNPLAGMVQNAQAILVRLTHELSANDEAAARNGTTFAAVRRFVEEREIPAMLESIRESGRQASSIVRNLLAYSRKDAAPTATAADLRELVSQTIDLASRTAGLKGPLERTQIDVADAASDAPPSPPIRCRPIQIQQVLLNLLQNALQATRANPPQRPPRVTFRTFAEGGFGCVEVEDNGHGLTPAQRARVFEPFFTTKPQSEGTGLGLFLCYHIVTVNHGGRITVTSIPGERTCFKVCLPTAAAATSSPRETKETSA